MRTVHIAVTLAVPSLFIILADTRLMSIEPIVVVIVTAVAIETSTPKSVCIAGQTEPKTASGIPSPIKAMYITPKSKIDIFSSETKA